MTKLFNRRADSAKRKILRNNMTRVEKLLWKKIRLRQIDGYKFRRQYSIKGFVLDFYSPQLRLAIELDGDYHYADKQIDYDIARQRLIESLNIKFVRFSNTEIFDDINLVLAKIRETIRWLASPPYQGGDGPMYIGPEGVVET